MTICPETVGFHFLAHHVYDNTFQTTMDSFGVEYPVDRNLTINNVSKELRSEMSCQIGWHCVEGYRRAHGSGTA